MTSDLQLQNYNFSMELSPPPSKSKVLALISGGFDSFFMLWKLSQHSNPYYTITPLYINYEHLAQKEEYEHAIEQCFHLDLHQPITLDIQHLSKYQDNNLTNPKKQMTDYYPGRNLMLLTLAAQLAYAKGIGNIAIGIIQSHREFEDSSVHGIKQMEMVINQMMFGKSTFVDGVYTPQMSFLTPISKYTKRELRVLYAENDLLLNLAYSCQKGEPDPCNKCPSCKELKDANDWYQV